MKRIRIEMLRTCIHCGDVFGCNIDGVAITCNENCPEPSTNCRIKGACDIVTSGLCKRCMEIFIKRREM